MVFHLINVISFNRINICKHCRTENGIHSRFCSHCGRRLIKLAKSSQPWEVMGVTHFPPHNVFFSIFQ
jgi:hypothetical protein